MKLDMEEYRMVHDKKVKVNGPFINRELSWLDFNRRVLSCALEKKNPWNERFNFLGITGSNLDEFISVRFANAYTHKDEEPYKDILKKINKFKDIQGRSFELMCEELKKNKNITFTKPEKLNKKELEKLNSEYENHIFPLLSPIDITENEINIVSGDTYVVAIIKHGSYENVTVISLGKEIDPIYQIGNHVVMLEDIVLYYMKDSLFINQDITDLGVFCIIKDASVILSHDHSKFVVDRMTDTIFHRNNSNPLYLELRDGSSERLETLLTAIFKIPSGHIYTKGKVLNYKVFSQSKLFDGKESYKPFTAFNYENNENFYNIFEAIDEEDILLHHPYDSYETVVKFIEHAATDRNVIGIRQTLYRVSGINSPIVDALCLASRNGKRVTVLVEIKARFDEQNNINVIDRLSHCGVNVIVGNEYLKTHCKMCIVTRKENDNIKVYSYVATGNFNEKTAKIYTDLSYFTSKQKIGYDLLHIFNILSGHSRPDEKLQKVFYAPINLRKQLTKCIDREIAEVKKGHKGEIFIKVNSLSDPLMANKIYEAADKGVDITIICRGVCSIIPRKHLKVKSIIGRFLEHSRIYYFRNGKSPEYYISSADLLTRNLDRRIETLISLKDSNVIKQLQWMIDVFKEDEQNSFIESPNGNWQHAKGDFDAHKWFVEYSDVKKTKKSWKR